MIMKANYVLRHAAFLVEHQDSLLRKYAFSVSQYAEIPRDPMLPHS